MRSTAGGDAAMARKLDMVARLWDAIGEFNPGFCLDTCHAYAGGEDLVGIVERILAITGRIDLVHANNSRDLSEALKRRCLYLHIDYPTIEREREIVLARVPGISAELATALSQVVHSLRSLDLKKKPSVSETLDWARTLLVLGADDIDASRMHDRHRRSLRACHRK